MADRDRRAGGWQLEQPAAEAYEEYFVPIIYGPWADRLLDAADLGGDDRVLDLGCGTGIVARRAAERLGDDGAVVGLDLNSGMLQIADATATTNRLAIEWRQGDAAALPFTDGSFDRVLSQQSFQYVEDQDGTLREIRRILAPGGRAILSVWRPLAYNPGYEVLVDAIERHFGEEAGATMRIPFPGWTLSDLRTLVEAAAFDEATVTIAVGSVRYPSAEEFIRQELASSPLADRVAADSLPIPLVRAVDYGLREYADDDGVVFPMESWVVTTQR